MQKRTVLLAASIAAIGIMLLSLAAASANRLSIDDRTFRGAFRTVTFSTDLGLRVSCPLSLAGSFHSNTISKVSRTLIGFITSASVGACSGGRATILRETLPWHVTYNSFAGTLPNITSVNTEVIGLSMQLELIGVSCLFRTTTTEPWRLRYDYQFIGGFRYWILLAWVPGFFVDLSTGGLPCELAGDLEIEALAEGVSDNGGALVSLRLI